MEKDTNVKDIKDLRKGISSAKIKAKAEKLEKAVDDTTEETATKKVPQKVTSPKKTEAKPEEVKEEKVVPVEEAVVEDEDEEDDTPLTEEEIIAAIRRSLPEAPEKYEPAPFLKQLLDPENKDLIEFEDVTGEIIQFEQVALIPRDEKLYAILKPVDYESFNIKEDEALVYSVEYDTIYYEDYLDRVTDEVDIEIIFQMYYDMLDEQGIE